MVDDASAGEQFKDFGRETFELGKDLERTIEQMENISVKLTWMAYDMVVLRTDPQLAKSLKRLENEFARCKAVVCGSGDKLVDQYGENGNVHKYCAPCFHCRSGLHTNAAGCYF